MALDKTFFDKTYPWAGIKAETIDGQAMVYIPKFYYKTGLAPAGSQQAAKKCWWVSDRPAAGYCVHPAFTKAGAEIPGFWVGAYECSADAADGAKAASVAGKAPLASINMAEMQSRCAARNGGGQTGWHLWHIYELAALQMLCLIELGSPDVQAGIGGGYSGRSAAATGSSNAKWRGIHELWGNIFHLVDGLKGSGGSFQIFDRQGHGAYINTGVAALGGANGYIREMLDVSGNGFDFNDVFIPKSISPSASDGSYGDFYWNAAVEDFICFHGGSYLYGDRNGLFSIDLLEHAPYRAADVGGRIAKI